MKIKLGRIQTETPLYVASGKEEIQLDDIVDKRMVHRVVEMIEN